MSRFAVLAVAMTCLVAGFAAPASAADGPQVSKDLIKPLKAAQDALNAKQYDQLLARLKEAEAIPTKSAYDQFIIDSWEYQAYAARNDVAHAAASLEATYNSQYLPAANRPQIAKALMSFYYQLKNYNKTIEYGLSVRSSTPNDDTVDWTLASSYYLLGKYKDALGVMQGIVNRAEDAGRRPEEKALIFISDCANKIGDNAGVAKVIDKLVAYYPKPAYWQNAMASLMQAKGGDDRLTLNIYRLANEVGILQRGSDFTEAAQIALDQGNPGEAYSFMQTAFSKNVYTEQRDKDKNQRLMDTAKSKAAVDRAGIVKFEADADKMAAGDGLVQIGAAYLGFGQPDKAKAVIAKGIAKGSLKYADEAYLLLGIAELRQKNMDDARKAFGKVTNDAKYTRLAKLWSLRTRG